MCKVAMQPAEVVKKMEQNAEHNVSNLCDWNNMTRQEQTTIFRAYQNDKANLPNIEITYDMYGPQYKEKPGMSCDGGRKLPEDQARETVAGLRKGASNPQATIEAVNKIQPPEQRQLVLKEMSESGFPGVTIQKQRAGEKTEYSITEDKSKAHAEAMKYKPSGDQPWDKPLATTELARQEAAKQQASEIKSIAQESFAKPWLPLAQNKAQEATADKAEGELHRKIAELRNDPNREKVLAELERGGAKITRDEQGRPTEIAFTRQLDASDPLGSGVERIATIMGNGAKITVPLDKSYEEMKAERKEQFYNGARALEGYGMLSGTAVDRSEQKDTSTKYWFER